VWSTQSVGQIHFTVKFMPFEEPKFDDDIELTPVKTGVPALYKDKTAGICRL